MYISTYAYILIYMQVFSFFSMFMFAVLAVSMCILTFKWDPELVQTLKSWVCIKSHSQAPIPRFAFAHIGSGKHLGGTTLHKQML